MDLQLTAAETKLLRSFRLLPANAADELSALAERLAAIGSDAKINWSDSWSDQDLEDFTAASVRRLDQEETEE